MATERRQRTPHPPASAPAYRSSLMRGPAQPPLRMPYGPADLTGPDAARLARELGGSAPADLTRQGTGEPIGERIVVHGRVRDASGQPLAGILVEIWQANAAGRYAHAIDQHPAPLDPNFRGAGHCITGDHGEYRFVTIKPGAYPWRNQPNAWRPAHIHFSMIGRAISQRLVTQMYFPGDPLLATDPIYLAIPDERARTRLVSRFDPDHTVAEWALAYHFDVVLGGRDGTPRS